MKKYYTICVVAINIPRLLPLILIYLMISSHKRKLINSDMAKNGVWELIKHLALYKHWRNVFYYRIGNLKYFVKWICPEDSSISIPVSTPIGYHFVLVHATNLYINAERIGDNFTCYQNVTIGISKNGRPVIGNNVTIYTSAIVLGGVKIGDNVVIGAGAVVVKDVPDDHTVVGSPARYFRRVSV